MNKNEKQDNFKFALEENQLQNGTMKLVRIEGTPVLLIKQENQIFAIDNRCPHMSCGFSGGELDGFTIICPCHDWRFSLLTGEYEEEPAFRLLFYRWKIVDGKILVEIK
ncbi:MAG: Rieske (2Fe-2S) protein [Candidatus Bathyarchaeota archaeon]|nr:Rieske (2Fe-2S) protein [Candidatus Bathyarchaeota archaeon]